MIFETTAIPGKQISSNSSAASAPPQSSRETPNGIYTRFHAKHGKREKHAESAIRFSEEIPDRYPPVNQIRMFRSRRMRTTSTILQFYDSTKLHLKIHTAPEEHPVYRSIVNHKNQHSPQPSGLASFSITQFINFFIKRVNHIIMYSMVTHEYSIHKIDVFNFRNLQRFNYYHRFC